MSGSGMSGAPIWNSFTKLGHRRLGWYGVGLIRCTSFLGNLPLVFKQMTVRIVGASQSGFSISNLYARYQALGYTGGHTP